MVTKVGVMTDAVDAVNAVVVTNAHAMNARVMNELSSQELRKPEPANHVTHVPLKDAATKDVAALKSRELQMLVAAKYAIEIDPNRDAIPATTQVAIAIVSSSAVTIDLDPPSPISL